MKTEKEIKEMAKKINDLCGIKESDTSLAVPSQWDLVSDKQMMQEKSLQVYEDNKSKHLGCQFLVGLGVKVSPTDIEEGMRVGDVKVGLGLYIQLLIFLVLNSRMYTTWEEGTLLGLATPLKLQSHHHLSDRFCSVLPFFSRSLLSRCQLGQNQRRKIHS